MKKILFICQANVCRSPMAEAVMRDMIAKRGLEAHYSVDSAAVGDERAGSPVDPAANAELERRGLQRSGHIARQMTRTDYDAADFVIGMDMENLFGARLLLDGDPKRRLGMLLAYTDDPREIEDPYMTGRFGFVCDRIAEGCAALLDQLEADRARTGG